MTRVLFTKASLFTLAIVGIVMPQRAFALAPASTCPQIWSFTRIGHLNLFALTLRANAPTTTDVTIKLRAGSDPYTAKLPAVAIDRRTDAALVPYRSNVIVLPEPTDEKSTEIVVKFHGMSDACPDEARSTGTPDRFPPSAASVPLGAYADLSSSIRKESLDAMPVDMYADPNPPPLCVAKEAKTTHVVSPDYPLVSKESGSTGTVAIILDLDNNGKLRRTDIFHTSGDPALDEAGRGAALSSTYSAANIGCTDTASTYLFRADFTSR